MFENSDIGSISLTWKYLWKLLCVKEAKLQEKLKKKGKYEGSGIPQKMLTHFVYSAMTMLFDSLATKWGDSLFL